MARRKKIDLDAEPQTQAPLDGMEAANSTAPAAPGEKVRRLSIVLDESGRVDLSSMRESTRQTFRTAISDPELAGKLGGTGFSAAPVMSVTPEEVAPLFDALSTAQIAVARLLKFPAEAASVFAYNPMEVAVLTPPAARVINKYGGNWLAYKDEIFLAMLMLSMIQSKVQLARMKVAELRRAEDEKKRAAPGPVDIAHPAVNGAPVETGTEPMA